MEKKWLAKCDFCGEETEGNRALYLLLCDSCHDGTPNTLAPYLKSEGLQTSIMEAVAMDSSSLTFGSDGVTKVVFGSVSHDAPHKLNASRVVAAVLYHLSEMETLMKGRS